MITHGVIEADKINWDAAKLMQKKLGHGMHNEPNSVLLEPGETAEIETSDYDVIKAMWDKRLFGDKSYTNITITPSN